MRRSHDIEARVLTRESIARTALALVDREGLAALSMRRLAQELGAGTMTLYGYFRDKEQLLDALVEEAAAGYAVERPAGDWRERISHVARELRRGLEAHPALVQLRLRRPITTPGAMRGTEIGVEALMDAGLDRADAASAFRTIFLYAFGFAAFSRPNLTAELRREAEAAIEALPADEYPTLSGSAEQMSATLGGDEEFERGLELILSGIEFTIAGSSE